MTASTYRAGIVGLGFVGGGDQVAGDRIGQNVADLDGNHREAFSRNERVRLVAGCDLDPGRRDRFTQRTGARTYDDAQEMLDREPLDVLSIATSTPGHLPLTLAAAERGVRVVYCEKPIAVSLLEAERMLAACRQAGTLLVINHNRRFHSVYRLLRQRIAAGELGELTGGSLRWGAGRLGCSGTHLFDVMRMLTGRNVTAVSATLDPAGKPDCRGPEFADPGGWGVFRMEEGLHVTVSAADYAVGPARLTVEGTRGQLVVQGANLELQWWDGRREPLSRPREAGTSMDTAVAEIVNWLDQGGEFPCDPQDAVAALEVILGFHASHARNAAWTELPLRGADRQLRVVSG